MSVKGHGGKRKGAGRPSGSGRFSGTELTRVQIPSSLRDEVLDYAARRHAEPAQTEGTALGPLLRPAIGEEVPLPLYSSSVRAGFPSPAEDLVDRYLDLNRFLIKDPHTTFLVRVEGDSMTGAGIDEGDILIVSRGLPARNGDIVVAIVDNEFTVKRLRLQRGRSWLLPENPNYAPIDMSRATTVELWGVVTSAIKRFRQDSAVKG